MNNPNKAYSLEEIRNILRKNQIPIYIIENIKNCISNQDKERTYYFEVKPKINKEKNKEPINKETKYLGRKKKEDDTEGTHTKHNSDNIIKKCKGIFFQYVIIYVNELIKEFKSNKEEKIEFLKLNYNKYVNKLKKESELELFQMKLKDVVSLEISEKYQNNKDFNKNKMSQILDEEKNNEILMDLLNMTFGDWIDVFTLKNHTKNIPRFNGLQEALEKNIPEKGDEEYFSRFVFYLFNYKNYFKNKKGRSPKQNKIKINKVNFF